MDLPEILKDGKGRCDRKRLCDGQKKNTFLVLHLFEFSPLSKTTKPKTFR